MSDPMQFWQSLPVVAQRPWQCDWTTASSLKKSGASTPRGNVIFLTRAE